MIFRVLGIGLLILGGVSEMVLFYKAGSGTLAKPDSLAPILLVLFLIGMIGGITILTVFK